MDKKPRRDVLPGLQITWKDGLALDNAEESTIEATLVGAGLTSHYSAIKRLADGDGDAAREEMQRIRDEKAQRAMGGA